MERFSQAVAAGKLGIPLTTLSRWVNRKTGTFRLRDHPWVRADELDALRALVEERAAKSFQKIRGERVRKEGVDQMAKMFFGWAGVSSENELLRRAFHFATKVGERRARLAPDASPDQILKIYDAVARDHPASWSAFQSASALYGGESLTDDAPHNVRDALAVLMGEREVDSEKVASGAIELLEKAGAMTPEMRKLASSRRDDDDEGTLIEKAEASPMPQPALYPWRYVTIWSGTGDGATQLTLRRDKYPVLVDLRAGRALPAGVRVCAGPMTLTADAIDWDGFDQSLRASGLG